MDIKLIVLLMIVMLAIVFIASYFLIPKEKAKMNIEAKYYDIVLKLQPTDPNEKINEARKLGLLLGKSQEEIDRDLLKFS